MQESNCASCTHHRNLGSGPGQIHIGTQALGTHHTVSSAVGLAHGDGDLRNSSLTIGIEQLGPPAQNTVVLLAGAGQEARYVDQHHDGNVEGIAGANEPGCLFRGINIEAASQAGGLVSDEPHGLALNPAESHHHIFGAIGLDFQIFAIIGDGFNDLADIVRNGGGIRDNGIQPQIIWVHVFL